MTEEQHRPKTLRDVRQEYFAKKSSKHEHKNVLADQEYLRRRAERLQRDNELAQKKSHEIVERNLALWQNSISILWKDAKLDDERMPAKNKEFITTHVERWNAPAEARRHTSMVLSGFSGRGKTWTSYAYMHELIRSSHVTPQQIVTLAESRLATIANSGFERPAKMRELLDKKHQVFFVDEVGRGAFRNEVDRSSIWFELMDHIYTNQLCLILTTNLPSKDIPEWFGGATTDRLRSLIGNDGYLAFVEEQNMRQELGQYAKSPNRS